MGKPAKENTTGYPLPQYTHHVVWSFGRVEEGTSVSVTFPDLVALEGEVRRVSVRIEHLPPDMVGDNALYPLRQITVTGQNVLGGETEKQRANPHKYSITTGELQLDLNAIHLIVRSTLGLDDDDSEFGQKHKPNIIGMLKFLRILSEHPEFPAETADEEQAVTLSEWAATRTIVDQATLSALPWDVAAYKRFIDTGFYNLFELAASLAVEQFTPVTGVGTGLVVGNIVGSLRVGSRVNRLIRKRQEELLQKLRPHGPLIKLQI